MLRLILRAGVGAMAGMFLCVAGVRSDEVKHAAPAVTKAIAVLSPTQGNSVHGVVTFTKLEFGGVRVVATVEGLTPGEHGFHVHAHGDCSAVDASSAGGHFNPEHKDHGGPDAPVRHVGDLGNLTADVLGKATYDRIDSKLALEGPNSIIGYGLIVHEKADDLKTQPTGNAGARVACGVIGVAKP
jgi:Cu-Zn family superoxide dismutase